ncbi:hypothetical protein HG531_006930 [Fusarium graminearum]|nr:hypothetical protein HG531_006930 [Fusarium graminearum]
MWVRFRIEFIKAITVLIWLFHFTLTFPFVRLREVSRMSLFEENLSKALVDLTDASNKLELLILKDPVPRVISVKAVVCDLCKPGSDVADIDTLLCFGTSAGGTVIRTSVLDDAVPELEITAPTTNKVEHNLLISILGDQVRLGQDTQGALAFGIDFLGVCENLLIGDIAVARDDSKDDSSRLLNVFLYHALDKLNILFSHSRSDVLEHARDIDDSQMVLVGATDFNAKDIATERRAGGIISRI